jgi:hypothetical protein
MLSIGISYWDLLKFLYFADTTERGDRGWKEAQRQGEEGYFTDNSNTLKVLTHVRVFFYDFRDVTKVAIIHRKI